MLMKIFLTFLKIGAFTFGGGFAMIPIIQEEVVYKNNWIKDEEFVDTISVAQSSPGPIAVNASIYVGYKIKGLVGAIVATLGTVIPSFVTILIIANFFNVFRDSVIFEKVFMGIRPAVVALIFSALYSLVYKSYLGYGALAVALLAALVLIFFNISAIYMVLLGIIGSIIYNKKFKKHINFEDDDE